MELELTQPDSFDVACPQGKRVSRLKEVVLKNPFDLIFGRDKKNGRGERI